MRRRTDRDSAEAVIAVVPPSRPDAGTSYRQTQRPTRGADVRSATVEVVVGGLILSVRLWYDSRLLFVAATPQMRNEFWQQ